MEDYGFKFKVGDFVMTSMARMIGKPTLTSKGKVLSGYPLPLRIVERHLTECYGGIQRTYKVRGVDASGLAEYSEPELEPWEDIGGLSVTVGQDLPE